MPDNPLPNSSEIQLLEEALEILLTKYTQSQEENSALKIKQSELTLQKDQLAEKTSSARIRIEAMLSRLKTIGD